MLVFDFVQNAAAMLDVFIDAATAALNLVIWLTTFGHRKRIQQDSTMYEGQVKRHQSYTDFATALTSAQATTDEVYDELQDRAVVDRELRTIKDPARSRRMQSQENVRRHVTGTVNRLELGTPKHLLIDRRQVRRPRWLPLQHNLTLL